MKFSSEKFPPPATTPQAALPLQAFGSSIAERLRSLMLRQGRSFEKLAEYSGLDKKKLSAVAAGEIVPPIHLLWKIANALGVPIGSLIAAGQRRGMFVLRKANETVISSSDGGFRSRALFPYDCSRLVEFYELTIAPHHSFFSEAHAPCTLESLVVTRGHIEITVGKEPPERLEEGDAIVFEGDVPHSYRNLGPRESRLYLVMSYLKLTDG